MNRAAGDISYIEKIDDVRGRTRISGILSQYASIVASDFMFPGGKERIDAAKHNAGSAGERCQVSR